MQRLKAAFEARNVVVHGDWGAPRLVGTRGPGDTFEWEREGMASARDKKRRKAIEARAVIDIARDLAQLTLDVLRLPGTLASNQAASG